MTINIITLKCLLFVLGLQFASAFAPVSFVDSTTQGNNYSLLQLANGDTDYDDIVARRIVVVGDVQGGYYRSCVLNEAGRFRRLVGTMTPPDDSDTAEIYVEGKSKMVDGFIRWCRRGNVGLSQKVGVKEVAEEDPTGLYEGFYVKTK